MWRGYLHAYIGYQNEVMRRRRIQWGLETPSAIIAAIPETVLRARLDLMSDERPMFWNVMVGHGLICA